MHIDVMNKRARKLIEDYNLTDEELRQIIAAARITLATFDPEYRANVTELSQELDRSRPTVYKWADRALESMVETLRNIRTGRPPKELSTSRQFRTRV
jgi:translation elongation factor EF-Tu-like GTPase